MDWPRLPTAGTRWVWGIDDERNRLILQVERVVYAPDGWVAYSSTLPEKPLAPGGIPREPRAICVTVDKFWENVTPIGGRLEDLSKPVSEDQYKPMKFREEPV